MRSDHEVYLFVIAVQFVPIHPFSFYYFYNDQTCTCSIFTGKYCILLPDDRAYTRETRRSIKSFYTFCVYIVSSLFLYILFICVASTTLFNAVFINSV